MDSVKFSTLITTVDVGWRDPKYTTVKSWAFLSFCFLNSCICLKAEHRQRILPSHTRSLWILQPKKIASFHQSQDVGTRHHLNRHYLTTAMAPISPSKGPLVFPRRHLLSHECPSPTLLPLLRWAPNSNQLLESHFLRTNIREFKNLSFFLIICLLSV